MSATAVEVHPGPVSGKVRAPGGKSHTHRALVLGAQSEVPSTITGALRSLDTDATLTCLQRLGARIRLDPDDARMVRFMPADLRPSRQALDCANSGTTLRLLAGLVARLPGESILTGDASLRTRPNAPLLEALRNLGASCQSESGRAPLRVRGPIQAGLALLPPRTSSQFASSLLLSLPLVPRPSRLSLAGPVDSLPYIDLTLEVASRAGLRLDRDEGPHGGLAWDIPGGDRVRLPTESVEGDWSSAAFMLVAAVVAGGTGSGSPLMVEGLSPRSSQGDRRIVSLLQDFGAKVNLGPGGVSAEASNLVSPGVVDVSPTPDLFPALCVLAAVSRGTTTFVRGEALRRKESDRIAAMAQGLAAMGASVQEHEDGLAVTGGPLAGAALASCGDHRIHMALTVAALAAKGASRIDDPACTAVSYPDFHRDLAALGAPIQSFHGRVTA